MSYYGGPTSVPFGDIEEMYLDYLVTDAGEGAYITLSHPPGYGGMWSAIVADGHVVEVIYIAEGETKTRFAPYDPNFPSAHAVSAFPLGDWDSAGDIDVRLGQDAFVSDKGGSVQVDFNAVMQVAETWGDDGQLENWSLTGLSRFATSRPGQLKTQAKVDVLLSDSAGTRTVQLVLAGTDGEVIVLASGSRSGDGEIQLVAQNNSQLSGTVDVTYTADITANCWITGRWCQSYTVQVGAQSTIVFDSGRGDRLSATLSGLTAGVNAISITAVSDTGVNGTAYSGSITVPGRPLPPGALAYVSGNYANTVVSAAASATPGTTYALYDVEELDGPIRFSQVAAVYSAGTGTISFALPALAAAAAGKRRLVIVAVLSQVEDGVRRRLTIEYDALGAVVLPRPNIPQFNYDQPNPVSAGRTITVDWSYDGNGAAGVATEIAAFLVAEDDPVPADGAAPDAVVAIGTGVDGIYTGSISVTAPANGNYQILVRARTALGTQSRNDNVISEPVPVSNATPAVPGNVIATVVQ